MLASSGQCSRTEGQDDGHARGDPPGYAARGLRERGEPPLRGGEGVRDRVRAFVDEHVVPVAAGYWDRAEFPFELLPGLGELGIMGGTISEEYGCAGWNNVAYGLAIAELARGSGSSIHLPARPERAGDDGHPRVGLRGAEEALAPGRWPAARRSGVSASPSPRRARTPAHSARRR